MTVAPKTYKDLRFRITVIAAGALFFLLAVSAISMWQDYGSTFAFAQRHAQNMARNMAEHAARSLDAVDLTLLTVKKQAERDRISTPRSAKEIIGEFEKFIADLPQIRGMIITNEKGIIKFTERKKSIGMDVHDRKYFKFHKESQNTGLYIGKPLVGRTTGRWFFSTSRKIEKPDGSFDGISMALVTQSYFADIYDRVEKEQGVSLAYTTLEGSIFAASSGFSANDKKVAGKIIKLGNRGDNANAEAGQFTGKLFANGVDRIVAYSRVSKFPIYLVATIPTNLALASWRDRATKMAILILFAAFVLVSLTIAAVNHLRKREDAERELTKSEQRFRDVVESASDYVWELGPDGKFTYLSERYGDVFGIDPTYVLGKTRQEFAVLAGSDTKSDSWQFYQHLIDAREPIRDFVFEAQFPDERKFHIKISGKPIFDEDGAYLGYRGTGLDITDQIVAEQERTKLESLLRHSQKMETVGNLARGIAHDFNNILNPVMAYSEMLIESLVNHDVNRNRAEQILKAGLRARNLIRQVLMISRQSEGEQVPTNMEPLVDEVHNLIRSVVPASVEIHQNIEENLPQVLADPTQIHQVIMNLCTNASHAMEETGGILSISVDKFEADDKYAGQKPDITEGQYVRLTISDTGHGMDEETREKIFDPNFTTKEQGKGTGLGLATVHGIVKSHGGQILVYSEVGSGTTFQMYLPVIETFEQHIEEDTEIKLGNNEKILVVDDEQSNIEAMNDMLTHLGYDVTGFSVSSAALDAFEKDFLDFDVVITDQTMPDMNGHVLAQNMIRIRPDIPVIMVTGFSATVQAVHAKEIGIREFLMKPVTRAGMSAAIQRALTNKIRHRLLSK